VPAAPAAPAADRSTPTVASSLPFTGDDVSRLAALAAAFTALGGAMLAFARRRPWASGALVG
jgi:LPXTG-motif cell wall-anchored protein